MDRRTFLRNTGLVALSAPLWACDRGDERVQSAAAGTGARDARMDRLAITTVCFRSRFPRTAHFGEPTTQPNLTLETAPEFIAGELGIHNVEVWDLHFDDTSIAYCERAREAAARVGSRFINIQVDQLADLSSPDAEERERGIMQARQWMDRAVALGAPSIRVNTGGQEGQPMDLERTADSFRRIAQYGQSVATLVLVENHTGYSRNIDNVVAIVEAVNHPMCRAIADFGNTPADSTGDRVSQLSKLFPHLHLVSAKGTAFNENHEHISYDVGQLVRATEESGYRGIYSIEMWPEDGASPPADPVAAARNMQREILDNMRAT